MRPNCKLTADQVRRIRTERKPDSLWARVFRVSVSTVRQARVGLRYKAHETPPDLLIRRRAA